MVGVVNCGMGRDRSIGRLILVPPSPTIVRPTRKGFGSSYSEEEARASVVRGHLRPAPPESRGRGGSNSCSIGCCRPERHPSFRHVCCRMAFPVPPHLPKKEPTDVSSAILGRISDADSKSLNAALAGSWITDLDESIRAAKVCSCLRLRLL